MIFISSNIPKGKDELLITSTSSPFLMKLILAPTLINSISPVYKSIEFISKVVNFSSSLNFIPIMEFTALSIVASLNFSINSIAASLSKPASGPDPIPSLTIVTYSPTLFCPKL